MAARGGGVPEHEDIAFRNPKRPTSTDRIRSTSLTQPRRSVTAL
jgi:hypothetical protein